MLFYGNAYHEQGLKFLIEEGSVDSVVAESPGKNGLFNEWLNDQIAEAIGHVLNADELNSQQSRHKIGDWLSKAAIKLHGWTVIDSASPVYHLTRDHATHQALNDLLEPYSVTAEELAGRDHKQKQAERTSAPPVARQRTKERDLHDSVGSWLWDQHKRQQLVFIDNRHPNSSIPGMSAAGEPDMLVWRNGVSYGIELKTQSGTLQENQREWGSPFRKHGGTYVIARSLGEVRAALGMSSSDSAPSNETPGSGDKRDVRRDPEEGRDADRAAR